jgi:hypothetical protein
MSVSATSSARIQHHRASSSSTSDSAPERDAGGATGSGESRTEAAVQAREGAAAAQPSGDRDGGGETNDLVYRTDAAPAEEQDIRFQGGR